MNDVAIRVEGLSKRYRIGAKQEKYKTLRDTLTDAALSPFRRVRGLASRNGQSNSQAAIRNSASDTIWALKDISFEVKRGEVVGIIGRNGAGKSTLLKILSRITEPTVGYADIQGRVGSLLEVGTGFHPELSGRENIYLNGSILGMKRAEIDGRFDEIVSFAQIDKFIDTPVKHFSSGMYLRLAFAVAAHLETEILLVDEVLAVGDAAFQKRCLGKMSDVAAEGRTVLLVSHNLSAVRALCAKGLLLDEGKVDGVVEISACLERYVESSERLSSKPSMMNGNAVTKNGFGPIRLNEDASRHISQGKAFAFFTSLSLNEENCGFHLYCIIEDSEGNQLVVSRKDSGEFGMAISASPGLYRLKVGFPPLWLSPGIYSAYFKALISSTARDSSRFVSDVFLLDVVGENPVVRSTLHPATAWEIEGVALAERTKNC